MEILLYLNTAFALLGAYLNARLCKWGFVIWIFTNLIFVLHNYAIGQDAQCILFSCYLFLSVMGVSNSFDKTKEIRET